MSKLLGDLPRLFPRPEQTITGIGCETADHCVAVGNSALVGVRKK